MLEAVKTYACMSPWLFGYFGHNETYIPLQTVVFSGSKNCIIFPLPCSEAPTKQHWRRHLCEANSAAIIEAPRERSSVSYLWPIVLDGGSDKGRADAPQNEWTRCLPWKTKKGTYWAWAVVG